VKLRQTVRHWAAKRALTTPVVGNVVRERLVDLHTRVFLERADPAHAEDRREHLDALFEATTDAYLAALTAGYSEAAAREITHIQANVDFARHGWTEMMEFPLDEVTTHLDRYADFFSAHGITLEDPLGEFADGPLPDAPATPERLADPEHPHAEPGYADDAYVERDGEVVVAPDTEPASVDLADAPGVDEEEATR
jgi:hypothetical protein